MLNDSKEQQATRNGSNAGGHSEQLTRPATAVSPANSPTGASQTISGGNYCESSANSGLVATQMSTTNTGTVYEGQKELLPPGSQDHSSQSSNHQQEVINEEIHSVNKEVTRRLAYPTLQTRTPSQSRSETSVHRQEEEHPIKEVLITQ